MGKQVDLWFGTAKTQKSLKAYLKEQYRDDSQPTNAFCGDQGETFFDHDFVESKFVKSVKGYDDLLTGISYSTSFQKEVNALDWVDGTNFIIADHSAQFEKPRSVEAAEVSLRYAGRFRYDVKAESVGVRLMFGVIYLYVLGDLQFECAGEMTNRVEVDAYGLALGGKTSEYMKTMLIGPAVPGVADFQVRVSFIESKGWTLLDVGNNGLTSFNMNTLTGDLVTIKPGNVFMIGDVEFMIGDY